MPESASFDVGVVARFDAADRVDDLLDPRHPDLGVVVDREAGQPLDRLHEQRRPTPREGGVELVPRRCPGIST